MNAEGSGFGPRQRGTRGSASFLSAGINLTLVLLDASSVAAKQLVFKMKFIGMIAFLVFGSLLSSTNGVPVFRLEVSGSVNPLASLILAKGLAAKFSGLGLGAGDQCNCITAI